MRDKLLYLLLNSLAILSRGSNILDKYAKSPGSVYHGRYTRDVHEPEFLVPRHVNEDGKFSTYEIPRYYDFRESNERGKRSLNNEAETLHLLLPFNDIDHHIELIPSYDFISPEMVIETRGPGIEKSLNEGLRFDRASDQQCHYRGHIRGHPNSRAALSLCDGVAGYIQTNDGRYFIEPVNDVQPTSDGQHVHMAYRREAPHEKDEADRHAGGITKRRCGTDDNWEAAWAEQLAKRQQQLVDKAQIEPMNNIISFGPSKRAGNKVQSGTHSIHRYIEVGLVCDRRFLDFHRNTDKEKYLLTVMNMVSDFYHDASCGNQIDIVVVRIIYLEMEKKEIDLNISPHGEKTLASFSAWAKKINPKDHNHPNHFDVAALISRYDLCSEHTSCDLMGLAYVAAACDPAKAASINEDSGLLLGIVVAHEIGHVMGCSHDEPSSSGCPSQDRDKSYFVMSPIVFIHTIRWSTCSRKFITSFLQSGLGDCLNDNPRSPLDKYRLPNMLPGVMYDADSQCTFEKPGSHACDMGKDKACKELWCKDGSNCYSKGAPPADGTKCGQKKWCFRMKCVDMGSRPAAVHGGWGAWGAMSRCSRTCGGGVSFAERECNRPVPVNGGRYCLGERRRFTVCNTSPCDPSKPPFRALQCAEFNNKPVGSKKALHKWVPHISKDLEPCVLYCLNEKNVFMKLAPAVKDGTPCKGGTHDMCISGACRKVGCDFVVDSEAVDDKCGICKGDGTECRLEERLFTDRQLRGYQKIVTIPRGSRSISVVERAPSENTLAIKMQNSNKYCLNGGNVENRDGDYPCAGAVIIYSHPQKQKEEITIRGPLMEDIQVQYTFYDPSRNPGVQVKWYSKSNSISGAAGYKPKYLWDFTEWGECSAKCGGGTAISEPTCIEENNGVVTPTFCQAIPRPEPKSRICNDAPCPAKWRVSQWSKCNACDGKSGLRHRKVQCVKPAARPGGDDIQTSFDACRGRVPKQQEPCTGTRPCKITCQKKSRDCADKQIIIPDPKARQRSLDEQRRMIDNLVDLGLARYLEKTRHQTAREISGKSLKRELSEDLKSVLRHWVTLGNDGKDKRTCHKSPNQKATVLTNFPVQQSLFSDEQRIQEHNDNGKPFTTPKPGSIVKDVVPPNEIVIYEVPAREKITNTNISDIAFQEGGDSNPLSVDMDKEKVYHGAQAIDVLLGDSNKSRSKVHQKESENIETSASATEETKSSSANHAAAKAIDSSARQGNRNFRVL